MAIRLTIDHLYWDDWHREHITKHEVIVEEAGEVAAADPVVRATYKGRFQLIGPTGAGRMLTVIVGPVPNQPHVYHVFSAGPASRQDRRFFQEQREGSIS